MAELSRLWTTAYATMIPRPMVAGEVVVSPECLGRPLVDLRCSYRARRAFEQLGSHTVGDLVGHTIPELLECRGVGVTTLNEIIDALAELGLAMPQGL